MTGNWHWLLSNCHHCRPPLRGGGWQCRLAERHGEVGLLCLLYSHGAAVCAVAPPRSREKYAEEAAGTELLPDGPLDDAAGNNGKIVRGRFALGLDWLAPDRMTGRPEFISAFQT